MAIHPKHPKCPSCGRALYKNMPGGKAAGKHDPWDCCRNTKCRFFGNKGVHTTGADDPAPKRMPSPDDMHGAADGFGGSDYHDAESVAEAVAAKVEEPAAVKAARVRIREVLFQVIPGKYDASTVGIALALVSQETGNHAAANVLIAEYRLTEKYGILPVNTPALKPTIGKLDGKA